MRPEEPLDIALIVTSCAYAAWLERHKDQEPDWTWLEVVVGVGYCLGHGYLRARLQGGDWRAGWAHAARSIALGSTPIIAGELSQALRAQRDRRDWRTHKHWREYLT